MITFVILVVNPELEGIYENMLKIPCPSLDSPINVAPHNNLVPTSIKFLEFYDKTFHTP